MLLDLSLVICSGSTVYPRLGPAVPQASKRLSGDAGHLHSQLRAFSKDCVSP